MALFRHAEFETSVARPDQLPFSAAPEVAFAGRSNAGKSSAINTLADHTRLAFVSKTPGRTQLINLFRLRNGAALVDLPGYGYAHVSKQERADFNAAVATFLTRRESLRHTYVLIDSRLPPQGIDIDFLAWLRDAKVPCSLVFTKVDKQSKSATHAAIDRFRTTVLRDHLPEPAIFLTSSKTKDGRRELLAHVAAQLE